MTQRQDKDASPVSLPTDAPGRLLALDLGTRRVGVAVCDELRLSVRALPALPRESWKKLLRRIDELCRRFDAAGLVVGLPLNLDGTEGAPALEARRLARNLSLSLKLPTYLQDERLTSVAAEESLRARKTPGEEIASQIDSESAAIILRDYLSMPNARPEAALEIGGHETADETVSPVADGSTGTRETPGNTD